MSQILAKDGEILLQFQDERDITPENLLYVGGRGEGEGSLTMEVRLQYGGSMFEEGTGHADQ